MKKLFHITSAFEANTVGQILALKIGERHCCFAITDITGDELGQLVYYTTKEITESSLMDLFANHPELNNPFRKVIVCYDFPQALLVPNSYFTLEESLNVLKSLHGFKDYPIAEAQSVPNKDLHIIYIIPKEISEWLNKKFPFANFVHHYSISIQNNNSEEIFWIDFRTDEFSMVAINQNKVLLAQTFFYSNPDDVIYYLLKTAKQFSISPKEIKLCLSGLIEKDSALFKELFQYFLNLEFRNTSWQIDEDAYPAHFFTLLNELIQCASSEEN